jgi:hypothetical protein
VTAAALLFFARRAWHGLDRQVFVDEAGHLLGARAIHAGYRLYGDYVDFHGPVVFLLAHLLGLIRGWQEPMAARVIMPLLALLATGAIASATCLAGLNARLLAAAGTLGLLAVVWLLQGLNLVSYHPIGGALVMIALAWLVVPAWLGAPLPRARMAAAGAALALTGFTAYSFGPSALLLAGSALLAGGRAAFRRVAGPLLLGAALATCGILLWLAAFGDVAGWLVFHVLLNQIYYASYIGFSWRTFIAGFVPGITPQDLVHDLLLACAAAAVTVHLVLAARAVDGARRATAVLLGSLGLALLNARGARIFQDGTLLMAAIGLAALALGALLSRRRNTTAAPWLDTAAAIGLAGLIAGAELVERRAVSSPWGETRAAIMASAPQSYARQDDPLSREIRALTAPDEPILMLVFEPHLYLWADRLPMRKYYEYLPWEADYAKAPLLGRDRDLCADLRSNPPPVIYHDHWTVWDRYPTASFMACVDDILAERYTRHPALRGLYVRNDRAAEHGLAATPAP